ncbi:cinnamoyl-CoA reductase 2 [Dendrobium catenatum]|uniref:Cinnamoyl-CoA reductase 1 n=1 Tax=Dendrobium catenatum TaxID=906689 RepID=A0A2I0W4D6_9ASPA|nr:cinnamoyl-CoA reductase 2 [Dendrobium catenatum]PKU70508.1 Cinnamoyl-CoA reductase 1 [Dendrobium catenatum]
MKESMGRERTRKRRGRETEMAEKRRVCVTGAGGFVASWLVKLLLSKGYFVHGTVRDPSNEKNAHLKKLENSSENLQLFSAELHDFNAIAAAIAGCKGVFHVASPVIFTEVSNPEVEIIRPALEYTKNVLNACSETKVKRVVLVSSADSVVINPNWPKGTVMDENSWTDEELCRKNQSWYCLSKVLAERTALDYGQKHGLDVVTVCPSTVLGPLLQSTVNFSSLFFINILKGSIDSLLNHRSWHFVDVRDLADALLLLYEKPDASGRYICTQEPIRIPDFMELLKNMYPYFESPTSLPELDEDSEMTSEKLKKIGWRCRELKETISDTVKYYEEAGLLRMDMKIVE